MLRQFFYQLSISNSLKCRHLSDRHLSEVYSSNMFRDQADRWCWGALLMLSPAGRSRQVVVAFRPGRASAAGTRTWTSICARSTGWF